MPLGGVAAASAATAIFVSVISAESAERDKTAADLTSGTFFVCVYPQVLPPRQIATVIFVSVISAESAERDKAAADLTSGTYFRVCEHRKSCRNAVPRR